MTELMPSTEDEEPDNTPRRALLNDRWTALLLLVLTTASVYYVGHSFWGSGWKLTVSLMSILIAHETGHYVAARLHGESPSPPFFLPLPWGNPFGTLGAVLLLDDRTRSRNALLDIGAAGPLAGLCVAVPLMVYGLSISPVVPLGDHYTQEGQSLLYWALKRVVLGPFPAGHDVNIDPLVAGAWAGFFVTFLNLLPVGQLDGGHVAYALLGHHHRRLARALLFLPAVLIMVNLVTYGGPVLAGAGWNVFELSGAQWRTVISAVSPWVALQLLLGVMARVFGVDHPPTEEGRLSVGRTAVGWGTLSLYVLLFVPAPWVVY